LAASVALHILKVAPPQVTEFVFGMGAMAVSVLALPSER